MHILISERDMNDVVSCGGVVFHGNKILILYKNLNNRYKGWVLPKGTVEEGEEFEATALREVREEAGVDATLIKYVDSSFYSFFVEEGIINKEVKWFLMTADSMESTPQKEEHFFESGYYSYEEVIRLLKFQNEKNIVKKAYSEYRNMLDK